ncbi:MAG: TolB family protein, partial [Polyangiales bacterium]
MRRLLLASAFVLGIACSASKGDSPGAAPLDGSVPVDGSIGETSVDPGFEVGVGDTMLVDAKSGPLRIEPTDLTTMLPGGTPAKVEYTLLALAADGSTSDITAEAVWQIADTTLGSFAGNVLTATKEGTTKIRASARGLTVETSLVIKGPVVVTVGGATSDAPTKFGGAVDAGSAPSFVYPSDGTLVPPNMNVLEFHFMPAAGQTLFELAFKGPSVDVKVYMPCTPVGGGCVYTPDATVWKLLAENGRGKDPITYTLRGVDGGSPGKVGVSASQKISFGLEDIVGGLYYWNAGAGATMRYEFGVSGSKGEVYMNAPMAGATTCVGCHVLSRNGKRISLGLDIPSPSPYKVFDVATRAMIYSQGSTFGGGGANFFTFNPDGTQIVTSNAITLVLRDAATGKALKDPLANPGAMPDWSPDGKRIVYAKPAMTPPCFGVFCGATGVDSASLELIGPDGSGGKNLVPFAGKNNFYPSWGPDGQFVIFNRSPSNANSYDAPDAEVWIVPESGGAGTKLATASTGGDSWPKWVPVTQKYKGSGLYWVTFSSRRAYGLRTAAGKTAQLWMTAIDPAKAK